MLSSDERELLKSLHEAGRVLMGYFGKQLELTFKSGDDDFRTEADLAAEAIVVTAIERIFPDHNILSEERGRIDKGSDLTFVIDPLDGTHNFVLGIPAFTINVALMSGTETVFGVIHHPVTGTDYHARKGEGAFVDGHPIRVSKVSSLENVRASYYCNYTTPKHRVARFKASLLSLGCQRALDLWAPGFCFSALASGRLDAIINDGTELYDYAAGKLIVAEAGGRSSDFEGNPESGDTAVFLMTNGSEIHQHLVDKLTRPLAGL